MIRKEEQMIIEAETDLTVVESLVKMQQKTIDWEEAKEFAAQGMEDDSKKADEVAQARQPMHILSKRTRPEYQGAARSSSLVPRL